MTPPRTTEPLTVMCAWHPMYNNGRTFRIAGPKPKRDELVSHGICKGCLKVWKKTWPKEGK